MATLPTRYSLSTFFGQTSYTRSSLTAGSEVLKEFSFLFVHGFPPKPLWLIPANIYQTDLFSVPVAAFIIENYKQLQPNSSDTIVQLLPQIS